MRKKWRLSKQIAGAKRDPITRRPDPRADPMHLDWIRSQPCALRTHPLPGVTPCEGRPIEAHHPTGSGLALRAPDSEAIPLCPGHHRGELHRVRGTFKWWTRARLKAWQREMSARYSGGKA